jgi:hypothetical protein
MGSRQEKSKSKEDADELNLDKIQPAGQLKRRTMKTAYELAMERLSKTAPAVRLSEEQKREIAELETRYAAKIAERELLLKSEIEKSAQQGDFEEIEKLEKQLASDRKNLRAELEEKKEKVRQGVAS